MIEFRKYFPGFVETDEAPAWQPFATTEELLASPMILQSFYGSAAPKGRIVQSDDHRHLMVEIDDGFSWFVLGHLRGDAPDLPIWQGWKFRARMADGSERVLAGSDIRSSCGDVLTLADGSTVTNLGYGRRG